MMIVMNRRNRHAKETIRLESVLAPLMTGWTVAHSPSALEEYPSTRRLFPVDWCRGRFQADPVPMVKP